jgi:hypothetical protein
MGTEDDKPRRSLSQPAKTFVVVDVKIKPPSSIDMKTVDNDLCKVAVVEVSVPKRPTDSLAQVLTKEVVGCEVPLMREDHAKRDDKDVARHRATQGITLVLPIIHRCIQ